MSLAIGRLCTLTACVLAAVSPGAAQDAAVVFDRLHGEWRGEGTLTGRTAQFTMRWHHRDGFAVLAFANAFADPTGRVTPVLNAVAVYRTAVKNPEAVWLDSRGARLQIRWETSDSALVSYWAAPGETGRTTYRVLAAHELEVVDEVRDGHAWRTFGTARYRRTRPDHGR
jgi:hypothetical protein